MAAPLTTARNKYTENEKNSTIYTPKGVCDFIYDLLYVFVCNTLVEEKKTIIVDTSVGSGNLLRPFISNLLLHRFLGYDTNNDLDRPQKIDFAKKNFLKLKKIDVADYKDKVGLVIQNPPFNNTEESREFLKSIKKGKSLLPELFLDKTWELYGEDVPCICITPHGTRLNQRVYEKDSRRISRRRGKRYRKVRDGWPKISSIISLPLDIFPCVEFHVEILIFNIWGLDPHYMLPEKYF